MKVFGPEKVYYGDTVSLTCVSEPALPGTFHLVTFHFPFKLSIQPGLDHRKWGGDELN